MERKIDLLTRAMIQNDWRAALRIAARFPRLGEEKGAITRAWAAINSPELYRQMGHSPEALIDAGVSALKTRYAAYLR